MARLGEICTINMGQSPDSSTYNQNKDGPPFFQGNADFGDVFPAVRLWCSNPIKVAKKNDILISVRAPIGALNISTCECCIGRGLASLSVNQEVCNQKYLWYVLSSKVNELNSKGTGSTFKAISKQTLSETEIPLPPMEEQKKIAAVLDKVSDLIAKRRRQLDKLDLLVKARFVEMFGEPVINNLKLATKAMTEVCTIIDGDRGKNYPKQEEFSDKGYCLFLNAKNVTATGFSFDTCMYITKEKDKLLRNGKLQRGDIVLTTRGTIGNLAFYDLNVPFENMRINSGMVILRLNKDIISEVFFIEQFKLQIQLIKEKIASGSAQPQLPISTMNKIRILIAPKELQNQFADFVEQTEKTKTSISHSLEQLETLKKSLMQEYFG